MTENVLETPYETESLNSKQWRDAKQEIDINFLRKIRKNPKKKMAHAESSILPATDLEFGYIHAFFIFGAIVTYFVDLVLGKFLKIT